MTLQEALTWIGWLLSCLGLVLALVALYYPTPPVVIEQTAADTYELWNQGPGSVTLTSATVADPSGTYPVRTWATMVGWRLSDDERLFDMTKRPDASGVELPPYRRYPVHVRGNSTLVLKYRATGRLGWLSRRARTVIEGEP